MSKVVDFAWDKPTVAELDAIGGVVAVGMYVSHDPSKNASLALVKQYAAAGYKTLLFFEDTASAAQGGYPAGQDDASFAYHLAATYGMPAWAPIVSTFDYDVPDYAPGSSDPMAKLGPAGQYAKAWHDYNQAHGVIADAAYGDYYVIKRLAQAGLCKLGVQTIAWSGGQVDLPDIALLQAGQTTAGGTIDLDVIESAALLSHLAWVPGQPSPVAPPQPSPRLTWSMWPFGTVLRLGNLGNSVRVLQAACRNSGLVGVRGIIVDGDFGPQTLTAVRNFQAHKNLVVDGIAGQKTRAALISLSDL